MLSFLLILSLWAFEEQPEYMSPFYRDYQNFEDPSDIDSEYHSDYLTFLLPFEWQAKWLAQKNVFDSTTGSLSSKRFMTRYRIKLEQDLDEQTQVHLRFFDESDLEREDRHLIFEFQRWNTAGSWGAAIEGETDTYKEENDLGFAILKRWQEDGTIRLFYRMNDFAYNKRNDGTEKYTKEPVATGIVFRRSLNPFEFQELYFRWESKTTWQVPDSNQTFAYERSVLGMQARRQARGLGYWALRLHMENKKEEHTHSSQTQDFQRHLLQVEREWLRWTLGYHMAYRDYDGPISEEKTFFHLPYFTYRLSDRSNHWRLGFDTTAYNEDNSDSKIEHRLNLVYRYEFNPKVETLIFLTFDADRASQLWEGGNMMFRAEF
tara:strand:+ start:16107 stop:17234 length:1128 start_codon:yes stop_codon:yes gene_type:complete